MLRSSLTVTLLLCTGLTAQAAFTQLAPPISPSPRAGGTGVTDGFVLYHFGGKPNSTSELNDLWIFTGTDWLNITPAGPLPPERDWYAAAFDTTRGRYVLFGGRSSALGVNLGDTWEFDGSSWTQVTPATTSPSARRWASMAFDPTTGTCVMFGGWDNNVYNNETWSWDGNDWALLTPATTSPSIRGRGRMSYDSDTGEMLYFGGRDAVGALADTWLWDGADWSQVVTANAPNSAGVAGRFAYGMTYDPLRRRHVLFGGTRNGPTLPDTWEFDGVDWTLRSPGTPTGRTGPTFAYVAAQQRTFLFGGYGGAQLGDTWDYQTTAIASNASYGSGCAGPGGPLTLTATTLPWAGDVWQADGGTLGPTSLGLFVYGYANVSVPLNPLLSQAPVGCNLLTSLDALVGPAFPVGGAVITQFPLPDDPAIAGAQVNVQLAEMEFGAGASWIGLYTSNGVTLTIGAR